MVIREFHEGKRLLAGWFEPKAFREIGWLKPMALRLAKTTWGPIQNHGTETPGESLYDVSCEVSDALSVVLLRRLEEFEFTVEQLENRLSGIADPLVKAVSR